jgi:drug/metabolite transporter (DMT)-like permease
VNWRKYLVLAGVIVFAACGDLTLSRGMKEVGNISLSRLPELFSSLANPWVVLGIVLLLGFFASYTTALSWADLTYVLPATSVSYVLLAFMAKFLLHEHVTLTRWAGILLISTGVGVVAGGPALTAPHTPPVHETEPEPVNRG